MAPPELVHKLLTRLKLPLPGESAQYQMAPHYRNKGSFSSIDPGDYRHSAVLVLLYQGQNNNWFFPLTLRAAYDGPHGGQVSLPGGRYEEMDGTLANTALRECYEEIGVNDHVEILGRLSNLHIPVSRYIVHPFLAWYSGENVHFRPHEREVQSVIESPVKVLLEESCIQQTRVGAGSSGFQAPCFVLEGHPVWGATAMILSELKTVLKESLEYGH